MHLFDPETDDFNFPFLHKFLPDTNVTVINLAIRHQGIIVPKGNPLGIAALEDLTRVRFINRQRGLREPASCWTGSSDRRNSLPPPSEATIRGRIHA